MGVLRRPQELEPHPNIPTMGLSTALSPANEREINESQEIKNFWDLSPLLPHNFHFLLSRTRQGPFLDQSFRIPTFLEGNPVKSDLSSNPRKPFPLFPFALRFPVFIGPQMLSYSSFLFSCPFLFPSPFPATESGREHPGGGGIFHPFW